MHKSQLLIKHCCKLKFFMCFHLFMLLWIFLQQFLENFQRIQFLEFVEGNVFAGPNVLNYFLRVVNGPRLVKCGRVDNGDVQSPGAKSCAETFNYIDGWKSLDGLGNSSINDGDGKQIYRLSCHPASPAMDKHNSVSAFPRHSSRRRFCNNWLGD